MITIKNFLDFCKSQNIDLVDERTGKPVEEVINETANKQKKLVRVDFKTGKPVEIILNPNEKIKTKCRCEDSICDACDAYDCGMQDKTYLPIRNHK
jgi:hypothetical protein